MACGGIPGAPDRRPGPPAIPADGGGRFLQHPRDRPFRIRLSDPGGNRLGPVRRSTGASRRPGMSRSLPASHTGDPCPPKDCEIALTRAALHGLRTSGPGDGRIRFARTGVILRQLVPATASPAPLSLGTPIPDTAALMLTLDTLRTRFGPDAIRLAATDGDHTWIPRCAHRSPCWTTRIPAFPRAGAGVFVAPAPS